MPVSTITLESLVNGEVVDTVVVSAPNDAYLLDDIVLDTDPESMYDVNFTVRTMSGAFEQGGRPVGEEIPIREPILPFWLTPESRKRFQKIWGTPKNLRKVRCTWDGPSGPRRLILKLAKGIKYTTEGGTDASINKTYHAVVSAHAYNPMYEGPETVASWTNPDSRFTVAVQAVGGTFPLTFVPAGSSTVETTTDTAWNAPPATVKSALEALPSIGAGHVTVTGTAGNYLVVLVGINGTIAWPGGNGLAAGGIWGDLGWEHGRVVVDYAPNTGWFEVWNPTDQKEWLEWAFDPAQEWQWPDFAFGQEREWNQPVGSDAARMIVSPRLTQKLSVMSEPLMDTYINADLSNASGLFNGVEPVYPVPPYTGTEDEPIMMPVVCKGPAGAKVTLRQRRFWSAESGLEA